MISRITAILDGHCIRWAVIGASAMAAHGISRSTLDVDLMVGEIAVLDATLWQALEPEIIVEVRRGNSDDPLAGVVRFGAPRERTIDLIVGRFPWQRDIVERSTQIEMGGSPMRVATPADLILLKLYAGGSQDRWDIEQMLGGGSGEATIAEVEERLAGLPPDCRDLWRQILNRRR